MAKKAKKLTITRRTLTAIMKMIPVKRRKNITLGFKRRKNFEQGFYDATGFHPIRASADYRGSRAGEGRPKQTRRAKSARFKRAQKRSRYSSMP